MLPIARAGNSSAFRASIGSIATYTNASIPAASSTLPTMDGTATIGVGTTWARADHIHPTDTTRYAASNPSGYQTAAQVTTALAPYALLAAPVFTGDARAVTPTYGDNDTSIATTAFVQSAVAPVANNVGRNLLHNSMFNVQQRGFGPWTTAVYNADRWANQFATTGGSCSVTVAAFSASTAAVVNDESARYGIQYVHTAGSGASDYAILTQRIEGVRRLSGKTITLSFWCWRASGNGNVGIELAQQFGIGGSPSPNVYGIGVQNVAVTATATRYSVTISVPSAASKTFGTTDETGYLEVNFWLSGGSAFAPARCNTGLQSGTFFFWGIQLEIGSVTTPLEKPDPQVDLANCQRFYQAGIVSMFGYIANGTFGYTKGFPTPMRAAPTITGMTGASASQIDSFQFLATTTTAGTGNISFNTSYLATADL